MDEKPKLRGLEAFPIEQDGKSLVALRDPLGVIPGALVVSPQLFFVAMHLDGIRGFEQIREDLKKKSGMEVSAQDLQALIQAMDQHLLLENERFFSALRRQTEEFAASPVRPAYHAGTVYPKDAEEAKAQIEEMLSPFRSEEVASSAFRALLVPHIDFFRGGPTYGKTYGALAQRKAPELFIVLGTSHHPTESLLCLTKKNYETPFGAASTDAEFVDRLASKLPGNPFQDEFLHRAEHSVEFQIHFLKFLFPQTPVVPILCGGLLARIPEGQEPEDSLEIRQCVEAIQSTLSTRKNAALILGVDLAHVGPRFGADEALNPSLLERVGVEDKISLEHAARADSSKFFHAVVDGGDPRNVCGLSPIYLGLRLLEGARGTLLDYRQCSSEDQCVTIAGMLFE